MKAVIGIDPGARDTGIIAKITGPDGTRVIGVTVHNSGGLLPIPADYIRDVITEVDHLASLGDHVVIGVESITRPNWHVGKGQGGGAASNPEALLGAAMLLGAVVDQFDCILIPPGGNGSRPLGDYPPGLVSVGEQRRDGWETRVGSGKLRHQRSAWDVAAAAEVAA